MLGVGPYYMLDLTFLLWVIFQWGLLAKSDADQAAAQKS